MAHTFVIKTQLLQAWLLLKWLVNISPADRTENYMLSIYQRGEELMEPTEIAGGTESIMVELTGSGVQYYELYINGNYYKTEKVEFTVNG